MFGVLFRSRETLFIPSVSSYYVPVKVLLTTQRTSFSACAVSQVDHGLTNGLGDFTGTFYPHRLELSRSTNF